VKIRKIIITQDIKELLDQEGSFLKRADIRIFPVASNEQALDIHMTEKADLIIAHLDSRTMSGEVLCSAIRESEQLCRVSLIIMHSGSTSDISRIEACRANAFIEKSGDPAVLLAKTRQLMNIPMRETCRAPVGMRVECGSGIRPDLGYSENISVTGMLVDAERIFSRGQVIWCWFVLPDSTHVRTNAEIVRVAPRATEHDANQYGIGFIDLAAGFRTAIDAYVRKRRRDP
jgi:DNA-binding response OmpR family regulator